MARTLSAQRGSTNAVCELDVAEDRFRYELFKRTGCAVPMEAAKPG
jgi:hypothetical protein